MINNSALVAAIAALAVVVVDAAYIFPDGKQQAGFLRQKSGSTAFSYNSTPGIITPIPTTSCDIAADHSNYWFPSLYYINAKNEFVYIPVGAITYYETRGNEQNHEFPQGFQMIAGSPSRRSVTTQEHEAISWLCLDSGYDNGNSGRGKPIPQDCKGQIRGQIHFPSCWDGVNLYKSDQSHTSYAYDKNGKIQFDGGLCPSTHPIRHVNLFMEVWWSTGDKQFPTVYGNDYRYTLSTYDVLGYGWHADFMMGWEQGVLDHIMNDCGVPNKPNFDIKTCPYVAPIFQTSAQKKQTVSPEILAFSEGYNPATGKVIPLAQLPGCQTLQLGPANAVSNKCSVPHPPINGGNTPSSSTSAAGPSQSTPATTTASAVPTNGAYTTGT
ncbi:hypothetical protein HK101_000528, partial [Irineochytrium annulatum]